MYKGFSLPSSLPSLEKLEAFSRGVDVVHVDGKIRTHRCKAGLDARTVEALSACAAGDVRCHAAAMRGNRGR